MLYYEGIEEILFSKHEFGSEVPDEFVVISGYLGPKPIERLAELPMKITVIGGMYSSGIDARLWDALEKSKQINPDLKIYFSKQEIHSKIYIWKKQGKILYALVGSANFSSKGIRTDYRETLADATRDTYNPLERYYKFILENSQENPNLNKKQTIVDYSAPKTDPDSTLLKAKYSYEIPLYSTSKGQKTVNPASGLNWGLSNGHVADGDAYIPIPKSLLKENQKLILPYDKDYVTPDGKRKRQSDPIELIWDDGTLMAASLEGSQKHNNSDYPKQLASYSSKTPYLNGKRISKKSILGRYLRKRLNVSLKEEITIDTLHNYGRDTITLSLIEDGVYYADFSIKKS